MGAWGTGSFQNDDALDWLSEFEDAASGDMLMETFEIVLEAGEDYLELPEGGAGIGAAEVVAALLGNPGPDLPDSIRKWVAGKKPPSKKLVEKARRVLKRIVADNSEIKEVWNESDDAAQWEAGVHDLIRRLGSE